MKPLGDETMLRVRYPAHTAAWIGIVVETAAQVLQTHGWRVEVEESEELDLQVDDLDPADSFATTAILEVRVEGNRDHATQLLHDWTLVSNALRALVTAMQRYERSARN